MFEQQTFQQFLCWWDFVKIALAVTLGMSGIISGNSYDFSEVLEFP